MNLVETYSIQINNCDFSSKTKKNTDKPVPIDMLSDDLIKRIFSSLNFASLRAGCLTKKRWECLLKLENNSLIWKRLVFQQDGCSPKLWNQYLENINATEQSKAHDPSLRLKKMGFVGLSLTDKALICKIIAERCSPLKKEIQNKSLQITNGVLIFCPTGSGKTMLARSLASLLDCNIDNIQLHSGKQIYLKWAKESKIDIGDLFSETLKKAQASINENDTFLLVIDEIDAILSIGANCSSNTWTSTIIDEFLAQMDALRNVYNVLIIGMTSRFEDIDPSVIKSRCFDEPIKIALPNLQERREILYRLTLPMAKKYFLAVDIDFDVLAKESAGLTGAEIQSSIRAAQTYVLESIMVSMTGAPLVTMKDLRSALCEVKKKSQQRCSNYFV